MDRGIRGVTGALFAAAAAMALALNPATGEAATPSLVRIDSAFMKSFLTTRTHTPFVGGKFELEETRETRSAVAECRERREFRLMVPMENVPTPDGSLAWNEFGRYSVMLCEHGPFSPSQVQATIDTSLAMLQREVTLPQPGLQDLAGYPLQIGDREGRVAVLFEVGHGVIAVPVAVVPSDDRRSSVVVVMDDLHFGEKGHEAKPLLADLGDLLRAVDGESRASQRR
jgi:hypothetical protein